MTRAVKLPAISAETRFIAANETLANAIYRGDDRGWDESVQSLVREVYQSANNDIKGLLNESESTSIASCHSCLLAPETSCEDYNRFLDRAMLVGTPENRSLGFFSDLLWSA